MTLFSHAFIRKRMISLAATASVTATSFALAQDRPLTHHVPAEEQPFLSQNAAAMNNMMTDMTIKPTGDVDRDFVAMMVPHHQGAVDMAKAELKYGHNERLRRLAREIVAMQQQQITVMRDAVADGRSSAVQSPEQPRTEFSPQSPPSEGSVGVGRGGMSMPR